VPTATAPAMTDRYATGLATRQRIRINVARFWSGSRPAEIVDLLLSDLTPYFEFEISQTPDVLLYGPYGGELQRGRFLKVFIGCENVTPLMRECDWAFGVAHEENVGHPRYMRICRWGDDSNLISRGKDWRGILTGKTRFCAFIYASRVYYREAFFTALSRYKRVDAPGRSMNNMPSIDPVPGRVDFAAKIAFLRTCKFVVAFENASRSGYNTEKLTHAIEADCVPIYWGDPDIDRLFNTRRFISAHDWLPKPRTLLPKLPFAPHSIHHTGRLSLFARAARRLNGLSAGLEQRTWAFAGYDALIERVRQLDCDDELYLRHLREPFLIDNKLPDRSRWVARWREIFAHALARAG
jgi:hypothetical protein